AKLSTTVAEATKCFVLHLFESTSDLLKKRRDETLRWLHIEAGKSGLLGVWPRELLEILFRELSATFESASLSEPKNTKRILSRVFHPDKHPTGSTVEKQFWHEMFVALQI